MKTVIVSKADLITVLHENRDKHENTHKKALIGWWEEVQNWFAAQQDAINLVNDNGADGDPKLSCPHFKPKEHLKDYDREIKMVDMSLSDEIELSEGEFSRYVMDEWEWSEAFALSNTRYGAPK